MDDIFDKIDDIFYKLEMNEKVKDLMQDFYSSINPSLKKEALSKGISDDIVAFYSESNGYIINWSHDSLNNIVGKIHLIKLEHILGSWQGDLYFEDEPLDSQLRIFRPIDQFSEEAHCGILLGEEGKQRIYFHYYGEEELYDLMIDFHGYVELALEARGFFYWQKYLLEKLYDTKSEESNNFKKYMPKLFKGFTLADFNKKINQFKLK